MSDSSKKAPNSDVYFDGSNWEDLSRLVTLAKLNRASGTEVDSESTESSWLARQFTGAALDWVTVQLNLKPALLDKFNDFVQSVRDHFGITDALVQSHQRVQLDALTWRKDAPTFFAEFDRLALECGLGADGNAKIILAYAKLPTHIHTVLAQQNYVAPSYANLRDRVLTLWVLDPKSHGHKVDQTSAKKPRCGRCGKRGHAASECRTPNAS